MSMSDDCTCVYARDMERGKWVGGGESLTSVAIDLEYIVDSGQSPWCLVGCCW